MKRYETILKYIGDGEYMADMEENSDGGWVLADEAQRLLTEARADVYAVKADYWRVEGERDELLAAPAPSHQTLLTALSSPDVRSGLSHVETGPDRDGKVRRYRVFGDALECSWRRVESDRFGGWEPVELSLRDLDATAIVTAIGGRCVNLDERRTRRPPSRAVTSEQVEQWADALIGQDAFGADEQVRVMLRDLGIEAPPRPVGKRYCAQCWLNGSGRFEMTDSDVCPNPSCVMNAHRSRAITPADGGDRG